MSKVYLIGDAGWDVYHTGQVKGASAEADIPVLTGGETLTLPGMAANVFANLVALGVPVTAQFPSHFPSKHRVMAQVNVPPDSLHWEQLARIDYEDWCEEIDPVLVPSDTELIVVSGYGKGAISLSVIATLIDTGLPLFVDTKSDPWPWLPAANRTVLLPNTKECLAHPNYDWFPYVVCKLSELGMQTRTYGQPLRELPSFSTAPVCVNGAGDTFLAGLVAQFLRSPERDNFSFALAAAANVVEQPFYERTTTREAVLERLVEELQPASQALVPFGGVDALASEELWQIGPV